MRKMMLGLAIVLASMQVQATGINFYGPCSPIPLASKSMPSGGHLGNMTISALRNLGLKFEGDASFLTSIQGIPNDQQSAEKLSNGGMRYYGWCASVNGRELQAAMSDVYPTVSDRVDWYLGYMDNVGGQWSGCIPAYKLRPALFCQSRAYVGEEEIDRNSPRISSWASQIVNFTPGLRLKTVAPEKALGPAEGDVFSVASLGEGGSITLGFEQVLSNHQGADLVVFENAFAPDFLELAYVEVSSNGSDFVRFSPYSYTDHKVSTYGKLSADDFFMMAGKYQAGIGQGFDLDWLMGTDEVLNGKVDLQAIKYVRIVDVVGNGSELDSFSQAIFDPYPTKDSAGFDLDAVGALAF